MNQQELRQLIAQAAAEGWTELDLIDQGLTELPTEIGQLTNLTKLRLSGSKHTTVPSEIGQLTNLTSLYLNDTTVPPEIWQLINLTELDLIDNRLSIIP